MLTPHTLQILVCPGIKAKLTLNSWPEFKNTTRSGYTIQLDLCQERNVVYSFTPSSTFEMKVKTIKLILNARTPQ